MIKSFRGRVVLVGAVVAAGWAFRRAFPRIVCPNCGNKAWKRLGGGLKECKGCSYKFFAQLEKTGTGSAN
jgi:ribosomal protein L37AE/L43A